MILNNPSIYAVFASLTRSAVTFLIWIILPFFYSDGSLEDLSYKYAIVFGLISVIDLGGVSNVMISVLKKQTGYKTQIEVLISVFIVQIVMTILISIFLLNYGFSWQDLFLVFYPIVMYFLIWQSYKKYKETTTRKITVYWKDIIITITAFSILLLFRNYEIKFLFYFSPIILITPHVLLFGRFKAKVILKQLGPLIMKSLPMLFGSIAAFVVIYLERVYVGAFSSQNSQDQYILTVLLQLSSLLILPIQGLHNRIWSYESTNVDSTSFINFVLSMAIIIGGVAINLLVFVTPVLYSVTIDPHLIVLAVLNGQLMIVVQLFATKIGSNAKFRKLGSFTTLSSIMNLLLVAGLTHSTGIGLLTNGGVSMLFLKYIILSILQIALLIYYMRPLGSQAKNIGLICFSFCYLLLMAMLIYFYTHILLAILLATSLIFFLKKRAKITRYLVEI